jgi:hypothetical protein
LKTFVSIIATILYAPEKSGQALRAISGKIFVVKIILLENAFLYRIAVEVL